MGIKGLMKFLMDAAPKAIDECKGPEAFTGRLMAIDASMCLYQFLMVIRENRGSYSNLVNEDGQVTSHIIGMLSRTIRMMEAGIKPVYVFDGKPPELKLAELDARRAKRAEATENLAKANAEGDQEAILKATKGTVKVTKEQNEQTKELLRLMGVPVVNATSEAEATCAALCRDGKVYASATEDADCLTFGTSILVRNLMAAEAQKKTIYEVKLKLILEQLNITMLQFIDFCILCGCDYCDTIRGVGPASAIKLIIQHKNIETVIENLDTSKNPLPENFNYQAARDFFYECDAVDTSKVDFTFNEPDIEGLTKFLVEGNSFAPERVERFIARLKASKTRTKQQPLTAFFGAPKKTITEADKFDPTKKKGAKAGDNKRKAAGPAGKGGGKGKARRT